jgi:hypothetical protein
MLKFMAIVGLLVLGALACAQKPLPVDRSQQQQQPQKQAQAPQPAAPQPCTSEVCKENAENAERYAYYKSHPKEYLKAAFAPANLSNWILAGLGAVGGLLAILTILVIKRQADLMKEQSDLAKNKERSRLRIEMGNVILEPTPDWFLGLGAKWTVSIYGTTEAFIVAAECRCWVGDKGTYRRPRELDPTGMPDVISPHSKPLPLFVTLYGADGIGDVTASDIEAVRRGEKVIYCAGCIIFKNVFDETWMLDFTQRHDMALLTGGETFGIWNRQGKETNDECQIYPIPPRKRRWFHPLFDRIRSSPNPN